MRYTLQHGVISAKTKIVRLAAAAAFTVVSSVTAMPLLMNTAVHADSPTLSACSTTNEVKTTDLSTWNLTETRATGHNVLVSNGLHVYTDSNTSTDKAAAYYATDFALQGLGDQTISQAMTLTNNLPGGGLPGLQLVIDFNNDGTPDGTLVGETIYGESDWWLTGGSAQFVKDQAPSNTGGFGSQWHGTINDWLAKFPTAQVKAIGYSLGSGIHGDVTIQQINLGCTHYTFGLAPPAVPTNLHFENPTQACGSTTTINQTSPTWNAAAGAVSYNYHVNGPNGLVYDTNTVGTQLTGSFGSGVEGTYTFSVQSVSADNQTSAFSAGCSITYDPTPSPTDKDQCKNDGWKSLFDNNKKPFKNQGLCVSYVNGRGQ
jgi:hypothetical protein